MDEINKYLQDSHAEMFRLLEKIVNINSYSYNRDGVNQVGNVLREYLDKFEIPYTTQENKDYGDHIIATLKGSRPGKILLLGHMDTAYPPEIGINHRYYIDDHYAYGPGVSDMKSGLVSMVFTVAAMKQAKIDLCDIEILFTPEEEIGSPISRALIEERASDAIAVFNLESGRPDGSVVTSRKGSAHLKFHIVGKAAHSGAFIEDGISAIEELAYKIAEMKKLTDLEQGITVNIGTVTGGVNTNVVAPEASGTIHIGFWTLKHYAGVMEKLQRIIDTSYVPGTKSYLEGSISFLPMERHDGVKNLYQLVKKSAEMLDLKIGESSTKGAADAGFTASMGIPTICGMGAVGGKWHSVDEYMVIGTIVPRAQLLATSIVMASFKGGV